MRDLLEAERPPTGFWDLKLTPGGLIDIEFAAQHLQIVHAADGGPLEQNTGDALARLADAGLGDGEAIRELAEAWRLQQDLSQLLKLALEDRADPDTEPKGLQALLARAGGARSLNELRKRLTLGRDKSRTAFERLTRP